MVSLVGSRVNGGRRDDGFACGGFERILKASFWETRELAVACPVDPREKLARGGGVGAGRTRRAGGKTR